MADTKITSLLTPQVTTNPATDVLPIVNIADTSMASSGSTRKITVNTLLGAGGTATLASATITGDLTVDTNSLYVNSSTNNVGLGTLTPTGASGRALEIYGGAGQSRIALKNDTTGSASTDGSQIALVGSQLVIQNREASEITFETNNSERYRLDSTGVATWSNVGGVAGTAMTLNSTVLAIGVTPAPWATIKALQVGAGASLFGFTDTEATLSGNTYYNGGFKYVGNGQASQYQQQIGEHRWFSAVNNTAGAGVAITFGSAKMTLAATGNLLVGTTTDIAAVRMQVWSADANNTAYFRNSNATTPYGPSVKYTAATPNNTGSEFLYCEDSTAVRVTLRSNGGIANYQANDVSLSDSRMKSDIKPLGSYWNKIKSLEIVTFKYKDQTHNDDNIGLIAQQVESVAPEFVDVDGFGETPVDGVPLKTIYTTDLYHAAIKALQEAMTRIEVLESKLA